MIIKKDSEIVKAKVERKYLALKAKKESSDEECSTSGSEDEEYAMAVRDFQEKFIKKKRILINHRKDKNQRSLVMLEALGVWIEVDKMMRRVKDLNESLVDLESLEWIQDTHASKLMNGQLKALLHLQRHTIEVMDIFEHVDNIGFNLLSIGQICDNKCRVTFSEHDSEITKDGKVIGRGIRKKGLYVMKLGNKPKDQICLATIDENSTLWHRRLGHANMRLIQSLASKELVRNLPKLKFDQHFCDACKIGKQAHASHKAKNIVSTTRCLELLHMDLFGPSAVRSYGGNRYTLVIVDDYSRNFSAPRTPQSNGVVKRKNRTLQEMSRTIVVGKQVASFLNTKDYLTKFDPKSYEGVFLGYSQNSKAYIVLNKHTRKVEESLNVTFDETPPPSKTSPLVDDDIDEEEAIKVTENDIEDETLEIDEIVNIKESRNHPLENVIRNLNQRTLRSQAQNQSNFYCFISTIEPKNVNGALGDESWIVVMQEELNQFIANDVWELVPQPKNMTIIGTKLVFRNKLDEKECCFLKQAKIRLRQGYNQQRMLFDILVLEETNRSCYILYQSAGKACQQALWMKQALIDYDVRLDDVPIMCDNKGAIDLSKNPVQHSRTKHIEICHHFLRDNVQKGHISIKKVPSVDNIADILTKPLKRESFNYLRLGLGMMEHIP
ncbi:retrovirus-related pol polyprotein from transposon TNT 1-94 [Tanacetum coccineum]